MARAKNFASQTFDPLNPEPFGVPIHTMPIRRGHGSGSAFPRVETLPANEQPIGVPAPSGERRPPEPAEVRRANGSIADRSFARELGRRGGLARAAKAKQLRALSGLGLRGALPENLRPFLEDAEQFAVHEIGRLAEECGGGVCPPNASALVQQAALAMAGSRASYAAGDTVAGSRLGAEVRSCLLGARELVVREAETRLAGETLRNGGKPRIQKRFLIGGGES